MSASPDEPFTLILQRAKAGSQEARDQLFSRLGNMADGGEKILGLARRLLPPGDGARRFLDSQDLAQTALRSGWLDLSDFRGNTEKEFLAWFRKILANKLHRVLRRKRPQLGLEGLAEKAKPLGRESQQAPIVKVLREEMRSRLRKALQQLPVDQRRVLDLRLKGLTCSEIARTLDLREDAVRKRESRAVARLRELLA